MKAMQTERAIPEFTKNDEVLQNTLGRIYAILWNPTPQSPAHKILNKAKLDQLEHHLLAAPAEMLPSC